ncbi:MAG: ABC-F type ribosomal protection protein [Clostridia bacterium]|nr:ABC-F type ribosomal protection protein [Clostridia bacterium]
MILLSAKNLKKSFGDEVLFDNVTFNIDSGDKIGFIGINGAGKSTLFKILTEEQAYDGGEIFKSKDLKIGYLDQYACNESDKTVYNEVLTVFEDITEIEKELDRIREYIEIGNGDIDSLVNRQSRLNESYEKKGGFYYKSRAEAALLGLGFSREEFDLPVSALSGGQKTRVSLSKILLSDSNLLLLDEPTNHLDIKAVEWLEDFLISYKGAVLVISHDRFFLDRVTGRTFEIDTGHLYCQNGNYSFYIKQREIEKLTQKREYDNTIKEIERLEGVVEQQRRWNREKNIKTAESKLKVIDKLKENLEKPEETLSKAVFSFKALPGGGEEALVVDGLTKSFDGRTLFSNVDMFVKKGEKVFLLGPNGCGKTTILKIITGSLEQDGGNFKIGANTQIGYYDQLGENLHMDKTVIDEIWDEYPKMTQTQIRNALAAFLFRGEDVFKEIKKLSGGERARVELCKLILKSVNFLIMDEPTNHMDIESKEALENALTEYDGTMLVVSHDRYFINKLADKIYHIDGDGVKCFNGGYSYYCEKMKNESNAPVQTEKKISAAAADYQTRKRIESEKRKLQTKITKCENEINETEDKISCLTKELENPEISADYEKALELSDEIGRLTKELDEKYILWEKLQSEKTD